ncbi:MAG: prepilin-type N-terminal cleavage/methylation domain-containing protein [Clostridiales bacterium]|nr:prepilin-type N-terminal cleavage/methylation domain-containing protein [Clostridiales bacterium]
MKGLKKKKGITLIALVITIVIMLLLAAVAIQMAIGNNRTYNKINRGKKRTSESRII